MSVAVAVGTEGWLKHGVDLLKYRIGTTENYTAKSSAASNTQSSGHYLLFMKACHCTHLPCRAIGRFVQMMHH